MPLQYTDIRTVMILCFLMSVSFMFAYMAEKHVSGRLNIFVILLIVLLASFSGLRDATVGRDTTGYYEMINALRLGNDYYIARYNAREPGFGLLVSAVLGLTNSTTMVFLVVALIINALIIFRFWELRNIVSFRFAVLFYLCIFYPFTFSGIRQCLAVAIVFNATRFIERRMFIVYFLMIILAFTFHISAVIGVLMLCVDIVFSREHSNRTWIKVLVFVATFVAIILWDRIMDWIYNVALYTPERMFADKDVGLMHFLRMGLAVTSIYIIRNENMLLMKSPVRNNADVVILMRNEILRMYVFYALLSLLGGFLGSNVERVGWYVINYLCLLLAIKQPKRSRLIDILHRAIKFAIVGYSFYYFVIRGIENLTPYYSVFG